MPKMSRYKQSGFTLVELVMVIILLGVIGTFSSRFISDNVILYQTSVNQNERLNDARFVLNRMSKELDSAIAFSVVVNADGSCMSFVPFTAAGQYLGSVSGQSDVSLIMDKETRDLADPNSNDFAGQYISILTTDVNEFYSISAPSTLAEITLYEAVSGANPTQADVTLSSDLTRDSAVSRYFIAENKVQYCLTQVSGVMRLSRREASLDSLFGTSVLMVDNLTTDSSMSLTGATQFSNAMLALSFGFLLRDGSNIKFEHQVVMTNVP
ncbi:PulJ/GspJ family protein [Moritella yayanosii]|uniref:Prepilin-type cleavage/methylation domain-containing protein n=1 Tax=Moritella yayanosii TaxID=69539 RepID=A0A330LRT8_9GAMM|nr:type II secretion system protein [Moritella yayanosii]SQD79684.1 Prepilin-type cleavage/methylation domain-containing protein [Moritella yayanosii]